VHIELAFSQADLSVLGLPGGSVEWVGDVNKLTGQPVPGTGCYRVQGHLALSRAIGDHYLRPYVSSTPDMTSLEISPDDEFIIGNICSPTHLLEL
jgi:hypothetical protein